MIQHTDKTASCFSGCFRTFFEHAVEATPDLKSKRPLHGSRPDVIVMDHDTATLNGTCIALHGIRCGKMYAWLLAHMLHGVPEHVYSHIMSGCMQLPMFRGRVRICQGRYGGTHNVIGYAWC
jgi:hypothetical protein